jgi:hypothetical protein
MGISLGCRPAQSRRDLDTRTSAAGADRKSSCVSRWHTGRQSRGRTTSRPRRAARGISSVQYHLRGRHDRPIGKPCGTRWWALRLRVEIFGQSDEIAPWAGIEHVRGKDRGPGGAETAVPTRRAIIIPSPVHPPCECASVRIAIPAPPLWQPGARDDDDNRDPSVLRALEE